ncbi:ribosomal protection-like ABC-F family protein [Paenibacillus alkalitolerans]|nr:ABC-F family ATP-binding cassette domain-containing protein [Paenibacillus alkalitolerans]
MSKMWGGTPVFQDLSLEIHEGDRVGLVGPNGCGKTTVLKLLSGAEPPDGGSIHYKKGSQVGLLAQIPEFGPAVTAMEVLLEAFADLLRMRKRMAQLEEDMANPDPSVMEKALKEYGAVQDAFSANGGYEMDANLSRVADGLGITGLLHQPFSSLSGGERTKVCLGRILLLGPDLLLLDEPTNHLDLFAVEWLESYLLDYRGSVLIVSHDRYFLDRVTNKIFDMEGGSVDIYHGNYSYFVEEKERRLLVEFAAYQEQQKKIKKMEEAIKRFRMWGAQSDNPKFFKKAASMQKAIDRMEKLDRPVLERKKMGLTFEPEDRSGKDVVVMEGVGKSFGGGSDDCFGCGAVKMLYTNVNMLVRYRESVAIVGENGSGKSTLLRMVTEGLEPDAGKVKIGSNVKIGYLAQHDLFSDEEMTVIGAFRDTVMVEEGVARHLLAKFLFYGASVFRKVKSLSGGERMRLRLAQLMHQDLNVLVLDEPTNHLDIDAREALEDALKSFPGTIICVSHDRYFLNKLFPVTFWLEEGTLTRYEGNYNEAKRKREERLARAERGGSVTAKAAVTGAGERRVAERVSGGDRRVAERVNGGLRRNTEHVGGGDRRVAKHMRGKGPAEDAAKSLARLEEDIASIERKIAVLESAMMQESDAGKLTAMHGEKSLLEAERELLYHRLGSL